MASRAGSPNKNKQALIALLQAKYPDYHPVVEMAEIANAKDSHGEYVNDVSLRFNAHKEIAQYVTPKLKALEVTGDMNVALYKPVIKRFDGSVDTEEDA